MFHCFLLTCATFSNEHGGEIAVGKYCAGVSTGNIYIYKKTRWFRTPFPTWQDQFSQKESGDSISKVQTFQKTQPPQFPQRRIGHPPRNPPIFPRQTEGNMSQGLQGVHLPLFFTIFSAFALALKNRSFYSPGMGGCGS